MLQKQPVNITFAQGLDTKTDPFQVQPGKFLSLKNSIFDKAGRLTKRNGFQKLTTLPDNTNKYLTTFNGNLTAIGTSLNAYVAGNATWVNKGAYQPVDLTTLPAVRNSNYQSQADSVTASNGLACVVYTDITYNGTTVVNVPKYVVIDSVTGQNIVPPTTLTDADSAFGTPRVFLVGAYFIILYTTHPGAYHLVYTAISITNPTTVTSLIDVAPSYIPAATVAFDGIVVNNSLIIAYNTTAGGQSVKVTSISSSLGNPATPKTYAAEIATMFSLAVDSSNAASPVIYVSYYDVASTTGKTLAVDGSLNPILAPTVFASGATLKNIASTAQSGLCTLFFEVLNTYAYDSGIRTDFIDKTTISQTGSAGGTTVVARGVGLASKAFLYNNTPYFLTIYSSPYQPTYFLLNGSGKVISKLAYSNAGTYFGNGIPNITLVDNVVQMSYLYKESIQAINRTQTTSVPGVYTQLGVNLVSFNFVPDAIISSEIGQNLNLTGGFVTMYDGVAPVERGFFLYPDYVETTPHTTGGFINDQQYYYQVTYEWSDNQGNLFRSAPSLPVGAVVTGASGSGSITVHVPTLRLTYKTNSPVSIVLYRWSAGQQTYYQTTSVQFPNPNDTTVDYIDIVDTNRDDAIIGNNILYTNGGVIENISPPASSTMTLFNNRLWLVDSEDRNLLWYSKQVIESTPVEMSDLLTIYVAPSTASEGSTGPITALAPMDGNLIVFKNNALGYINGIGPDNTGANSQYSDFTLINSVVGCTNQSSIVFTPNGLMFQSNKGIWLVDRNLSTNYIGAPVEELTQGTTVLSALNIPMTNQVRFTLDSGITLLYDYYYNQWGTFTGIPAISSTVWGTLHTYANSLGEILQESPGKYLDNSSPVLMSFTTSWMNLAGLQGFERFYEMCLLGTYVSPFKLNVQLAYNYNSSSLQNVLVTPAQAPSTWGSEQLWGSGTNWGAGPSGGTQDSGNANVFEARVFSQIQKCESFQITVNELFDSSFGVMIGEGLTLSGLNLVVGMKKGYRTNRASRSFG